MKHLFAFFLVIGALAAALPASAHGPENDLTRLDLSAAKVAFKQAIRVPANRTSTDTLLSDGVPRRYRCALNLHETTREVTDLAARELKIRDFRWTWRGGNTYIDLQIDFDSDPVVSSLRCSIYNTTYLLIWPVEDGGTAMLPSLSAFKYELNKAGLEFVGGTRPIPQR